MVLFTQLEGLLEIVFGCFLVAVAQFERTEAYVVIGAVGVGLDTFVEVSFGFGVVFSELLLPGRGSNRLLPCRSGRR